jgi:hypothetical protein
MQGKIGFTTFSIGLTTTSGNVIELWMKASPTKYIVSSLSIAPITKTKTISVSQLPFLPLGKTGACSFSLGVVYRLEVGLNQTGSGWILSSELYNEQRDTKICDISMAVTNFVPNQFFSEPFRIVLSQSSSATKLKARKVMDTAEIMSVSVKQVGVACVGSACSTSSPNLQSNSSSTVGIVAGVIVAVIAIGAATAVAVLIVAVIVYKRKKSERVYIVGDSTIQEEREKDVELPQNLAPPTKYEAFVDPKLT